LGFTGVTLPVRNPAGSRLVHAVPAGVCSPGRPGERPRTPGWICGRVYQGWGRVL